METKQNNKYVEVMYELYVPNETGNWDMVEKTSKEHPLKFVTGMDFALTAFEEHILATAEGETFDFVVPVAEAYGEYVDEHVVELDKTIFEVNGKFDEVHIYPGNVIPLANEDGNQFNAIVEEVQDSKVVVNLNHPLAGKDLHFRGRVLVSREATLEEMSDLAKKMAGDDECCCGHCHDEACSHEHGEGCGCGCH